MPRYTTFSDRSQLDHLRRIAYYVQRGVPGYRLRQAAMHVLLQGLRFVYKEERAASRTRSCLARQLRRSGHLSLGQSITQEQCRQIQHYLLDRQLVDYQGKFSSFTLAAVPAGLRLGDYPLDIVVNCPHVLDIANRSDFLNLATDYLGFKPTITDLSLRWAFPSEQPDSEIEKFHRSSEIGTFDILVYLTDVHFGSGPYVYVPETHLERVPLKRRNYSHTEIKRNYGGAVSITGSAGSAFAIDTKGIHKRSLSTERPGLVLAIEYSLVPPFQHNYEPVAYFGKKNLDPYVNRFIIYHSDTVPYRAAPSATVSV